VVAELQLRGGYVPLVTPFDRRGDVDLDALEHLTDEVLSAGAAGVVALATTGEPTSLDDAERDAVVAACSRVCTDRGAGLIVGAGSNDIRTTLARHEALADVPGVVASLAVVPYYVRPTEAAIVAHFQLVAARSPVPLITYNVPYRTGQGLAAASSWSWRPPTTSPASSRPSVPSTPTPSPSWPERRRGSRC
jgi:4-hydroxy-tetrahydrodipicolinate synthase